MIKVRLHVIITNILIRICFRSFRAACSPAWVPSLNISFYCAPSLKRAQWHHFTSHGFSILWPYYLMVLWPWKEGKVHLLLLLKRSCFREVEILAAWFDSRSLTWITVTLFRLDRLGKKCSITFHNCNLVSLKSKRNPWDQSGAASWWHITFPLAVKRSSAVQQWALFLLLTNMIHFLHIDKLLQSLAVFNKCSSGLSQTKFTNNVDFVGAARRKLLNSKTEKHDYDCLNFVLSVALSSVTNPTHREGCRSVVPRLFLSLHPLTSSSSNTSSLTFFLGTTTVCLISCVFFNAQRHKAFLVYLKSSV